MIRAVLFDYGLTLVTFAYPHEELLEVLREVWPTLPPGTPPPEQLMTRVLEPLEERLQGLGEDEVDYMSVYEAAWRAAGVDVPRGTLYEILDREQQVWDRAARPSPHAVPVLAELRRRGKRTGIASNAPFPPEMLQRQLRTVGLAAHLDAAVFSSEIGRRKPAPELYLTALERLAVPAAAALFVGDRADWDYDAPRSLGMQAVLSTELARTPAPPGVPTIATLTELLELVP
ncbi:MAG TPA: HAD family hydrolase [Candidatus Dormibacteraeota bacterium]